MCGRESRGLESSDGQRITGDWWDGIKERSPSSRGGPISRGGKGSDREPEECKREIDGTFFGVFRKSKSCIET